MHQRIVLALVVCAAGVIPVRAQRPTFEVASIKRNTSGSENASVRGQPGGRLTITNNTLWNIIRNAYSLQGFQIIGGPDWINVDRWDVVAKAEGDAPPQQMIAMVQTLLADRFKLVVRRETREMPIYALVVVRNDGTLGPQLHRSTTDCAAVIAEARARGGVPPRPPDGRVLCGMRVNNGRIAMNAETMVNLVRNLSPIAGRSIIDKTGLTGGFDMELTWTPDLPSGNAPGGTPPPANDGPSLFTAMQEQLGLKLDPQRGPVEVLVIDSAERSVED